MPHTIAEVAKEKGARLLRRGVDWQYEVQDNGWRFSDAQGVLESLPRRRCHSLTRRLRWQPCAPAD